MAEGRRSSISGVLPAGSSPSDEARQPLGHLRSLGAITPEPKHQCSYCSRTLVQESPQNPCGNRYYAACLAWIIKNNNNNPICQSCKEKKSAVAQEENLLTIEKALSTAV